MTTRKLSTIVLYTLVMLIIGRNLSFLPKIPTVEQKAQALKLTTLQRTIQTQLQKDRASYSIYYHDLSSDQSFGIQEHQLFTGASVNKVHIVAALYHLAGKGTINLDEQITLQKNDIQDYGTGSLRYHEPGTSYSLRTLAKLTLNESDNTAARIIANKIAMERVQNLMDRFGLTQTNMASNKTSLADLYILFSKLYHAEVTTPALTKELLGFMKDTAIEDRLTLLLPQATTVYHKTGDALDHLHDVGIIEANGKAYFLGIMTADVGNQETHTKDRIAQISKNVYDVVMNE